MLSARTNKPVDLNPHFSILYAETAARALEDLKPERSTTSGGKS